MSLPAVEAVTTIKSIAGRERTKAAEPRFSGDRMADDYRAVHAQTLEGMKREEPRPWGYFEVLSECGDHKVKRVVVYPGKRLSLQSHGRRSEHWTIVSGSPVVTLDGTDITLKPGQSIDIPLGARHRIANPGTEPVVFVEVQMGDYFGEDDIERFDDDFGRTNG